MKPQYKIAELMIDEDGQYTANILGEHASQGGSSFGMAGMSANKESIVTVFQFFIFTYHDQYIKLIKDRIKEEDNA